jgi:hypothetical protein
MAEGAFGLVPPDISQTDYLANIPATNSARFNATLPPGGAFPLVEKNVSTGVSIGSVVYVRGSSMSIRYRIRNRNDILLHVHFKFTEPKYERKNYPGVDIALGGSDDEEFTIAAGQYHDVTASVTGLPNYVTLGWLKTKINISSEAGGIVSTGPTREEFVYLTDAQPLAPLAVPWTEVLDDACNWADGQVGDADCAYYSTFGLFFSQKFAYNSGTYQFPTNWVDENWLFLLTNFVNYQGYRSGNCVDVSAYLHLSLCSIGADSILTQLYGGTQYPVFVTNPICPIGSDPDSPPSGYVMLGWSMHQICRAQGATYDSCLALQFDPAGAAYENPPAGWTPDGHWQSPAENPQFGVVKRYGATTDFFGTEQNPNQLLDPSLPSEVVPRVELEVELAGIN